MSVSDNGTCALDDLASWLRARREEIGLTQRELAAAAGVSEQTIGRYERGEGYTELLRILDALGVELRPAPPDRSARALNAELHELRKSVERLGRRQR